jgi:hypothetical protein
MAVSTIAHKPDLTAQQLKEIFRKRFEGTYQVEDWKGPLIGQKRDFTVNKNPFVGIALGLDQTGSETKIVYTGYCPKIWARMLLGAALGMLLWNGPTNEVKQFIETAPEFK